MFFDNIIVNFYCENRFPFGAAYRALRECCRFGYTPKQNEERVEDIIKGIKDLSQLEEIANHLDGIYDGNVNNKQKAIVDCEGKSFTMGEFFENCIGVDVRGCVQDRICEIQRQEGVHNKEQQSLTHRIALFAPLDNTNYMVKNSVLENIEDGKNTEDGVSSVGGIVENKMNHAFCKTYSYVRDEGIGLKIRGLLFNLKNQMREVDSETDIITYKNPKDIDGEKIVNETLDEYKNEDKKIDIKQLEQASQFLKGVPLNDFNSHSSSFSIGDEFGNTFTVNEFIKDFYGIDVCALIQTRIETLKQEIENQPARQAVQQQDVLPSSRVSATQVEMLDDKRSNNKEEQNIKTIEHI
ncbi:MAG: hypothetical protein LBC92_00125 [Rickettsiales bacterium]|nr:hypothetical protein [Rickettsiales bacterium]